MFKDNMYKESGKELFEQKDFVGIIDKVIRQKQKVLRFLFIRAVKEKNYCAPVLNFNKIYF